MQRIVLFLICMSFLIGCGSSKRESVDSSANPEQEFQNSTEEFSGSVVEKEIRKELSDYIDAAEYEDITFSDKIIDGIPILEAYAESQQEQPLVLLLHGATGCKESMGYLLAHFAQAGMHAVAVDLRAHGERTDEVMPFFSILTETGKDLNKVISYFNSCKNVNAQTFGITGFSMGGMIAYWYAAYGNYTPKIIAPIASTPDWTQLDGDSLTTSCYEDSLYEPCDANNSSEMVIAAENNPINQYERFFDISLLIEHGTNDETISIAGDQALYDRLISDGHPNAVFFKDDSVHQIPSGFVPTLMRTFQDYLK